MTLWNRDAGGPKTPPAPMPDQPAPATRAEIETTAYWRASRAARSDPQSAAVTLAILSTTARASVAEASRRRLGGLLRREADAVVSPS